MAISAGPGCVGDGPAMPAGLPAATALPGAGDLVAGRPGRSGLEIARDRGKIVLAAIGGGAAGKTGPVTNGGIAAGGAGPPLDASFWCEAERVAFDGTEATAWAIAAGVGARTGPCVSRRAIGIPVDAASGFGRSGAAGAAAVARPGCGIAWLAAPFVTFATESMEFLDAPLVCRAASEPCASGILAGFTMTGVLAGRHVSAPGLKGFVGIEPS